MKEIIEIVARELYRIKIDNRASGMRLSEASTARNVIKSLDAAGYEIKQKEARG